MSYETFALRVSNSLTVSVSLRCLITQVHAAVEILCLFKGSFRVYLLTYLLRGAEFFLRS